MNKHFPPLPGPAALFRYLLKWSIMVLPLSLFSGTAVALFLWLLDLATSCRQAHSRLTLLLPVAGILIYFLYRYAGKDAAAGNNLVIDEIHQPGGGVPFRMAPLVVLGTLITHLFGGSAGREGTAVQVGGSIAARLARRMKLDAADTGILLTAGIAGGFGAVFGTPLAGAVFAAEVLAIGRIRYRVLPPCLLAALLSDFVTRAWGIQHTLYHVRHTGAAGASAFHGLLVLKVIAAGIVFGLVARIFAWLVHRIKDVSTKYIRPGWLVPVAGGLLVLALSAVLGTSDYLGLGVYATHPGGASIVNAFLPEGVDSMAWCWKLIFTAVTLGMGFKGGEVTPLFFIGATLGSTLAGLMGTPPDLFAALGFIAVFAGAANTPLACTLLGVELFGAGHAGYYACACYAAYYASGHAGIYHSQRVIKAKYSWWKNGKITR